MADRKSTVFTRSADKADAYLRSIGQQGEGKADKSNGYKKRKHGKVSGVHPMSKGSRPS